MATRGLCQASWWVSDWTWAVEAAYPGPGEAGGQHRAAWLVVGSGQTSESVSDPF